ncbi:MAG: hypothetical protein IJL26_01890 [Clostridia bacterium]|nr:hypothetical protein [Clostridia bacterium]
MEAVEFFRRLKQHCRNQNEDCRSCCFLEICYRAKSELPEEIARDAVRHLEKNDDKEEELKNHVHRDRVSDSV